MPRPDAAKAATKLDAVVSKQLVGNPTVLAAWRVAHRILAKQGAIRGGAATPVPTTTSAAGSSDVVTAAA